MTAASVMQHALGTENLGMLYYKPLRHPSGAVILSLVHHVKNPKVLLLLLILLILLILLLLQILLLLVPSPRPW